MAPYQIGTPRQIILPVDAVDAAVSYYRDGLGLELRFQDGDRWAALALGDLTLALAGPGEHPAGAEAALGVKVAGLEAAIEAITGDGGALLVAPREGAHERRATVRDRFGTVLALYEPR
jgi:catechol 2,3-dioxygenase-like lactoylglutathione lyase family enzyme